MYQDISKGNTNLSFGQALRYLKAGHTVQREGWNGKGMWLVLVEGSRPTVKADTTYGSIGLLGKVTIDAHIDMFTAAGTMQPGWLASQADMLAEDWRIENANRY